jgi:hypothetical protein
MHEFIKSLRQIMPSLDLRDRMSFLANLIFDHQLMIASEDLLREAIAHSTGDLQDFFIDHLEDERGHAQWLEDDLAGVELDVRAMPISPEAVAMAGSQHYLIRYVDACALLGYMLVLEGFSMPLGYLDEVERIHGKGLCRTLRYHAENDAVHGPAIVAQIEALDVNRRELVKQNAVQTVFYIRAAVAKFGGSHA